MNRFGELPRFFQIRMRSLAPEQIRIRSIGQAARDGRLDSAPNAEETFRRALASAESAVARVDVAGQQMRAVGVGARHDQRRYAHHIGRQPRRYQFLNGFGGRNQNLAAQVSALLRRRKLILKVHASRARLDHALHQFERIQRATEAGFRIGHQRRKPGLPRSHFPLRMMHLVGPLQRAVDAAAKIRNAVRRIQALVGIHLPRIVGVRRHLPSAHIDRLQSRLHLLHRLVAGHRAQRVDVRLGLQSSHSRSAPRRASVCSI